MKQTLCALFALWPSVLCAQTVMLTNADLGIRQAQVFHVTAEQLASLKAHETPVLPEFARGPIFASTQARGATAGPWEFPPLPAARRLDGTRLDVSPIVYGSPYGHWNACTQIAPFFSKNSVSR